MNKLTPLSRILITLIILAILFFGAKYLLGDKLNLGGSNDGTVVTEQVDNSSSEEESQSENAKPEMTASSSSFNFTPPKPIGGKLMGVVELGASGFNSFIVKKDNSDNWEKVKYEWGNSLVADGMASNEDVTSGLKRYIGSILDYGVSGKNVHFVVSSGALKEAAVQPIIAALKGLGYVVNEVTPAQEGEYALRCVLPKAYNDSAFVVDIGSGNTKVSWMDGGRVTAKEAQGAKYYTNGVSDSQAYNEANTIGKAIPKKLSKTCFIIGGVPFNLAEVSRKGDERYTVLNGPSAYSKLAEEKGKKVESGLNIYQGLKDGSGCDEFVFDWDANFTIGFLLSLPG